MKLDTHYVVKFRREAMCYRLADAVDFAPLDYLQITQKGVLGIPLHKESGLVPGMNNHLRGRVAFAHAFKWQDMMQVGTVMFVLDTAGRLYIECYKYCGASPTYRMQITIVQGP